MFVSIDIGLQLNISTHIRVQKQTTGLHNKVQLLQEQFRCEASLVAWGSAGKIALFNDEARSGHKRS